MPFKNIEERRAYAKAHYEAHRNAYLKKNKATRRTTDGIINKLKEAPCTDCKMLYPPYAMQFDHVSGKKVACVAHLIRSKGIATVLAEIEKCELVCAVCHAIRTWNRTQEG